MIIGAHVLLFSPDPEADRAFFRDILQFRHVDVGGGWLIFKLPPSEAAVHPADSGEPQASQNMLGAQFYLMCDDLQALVKSLQAKQIRCTEITTERWGIKTSIKLPSGGEIGLYQPTHPTALNL